MTDREITRVAGPRIMEEVQAAWERMKAACDRCRRCGPPDGTGGSGGTAHGYHDLDVCHAAIEDVELVYDHRLAPHRGLTDGQRRSLRAMAALGDETVQVSRTNGGPRWCATRMADDHSAMHNDMVTAILAALDGPPLPAALPQRLTHERKCGADGRMLPPPGWKAMIGTDDDGCQYELEIVERVDDEAVTHASRESAWRIYEREAGLLREDEETE
jgi:hypothetical protein